MEGRFNGGFLALPLWVAYIRRGLFSEFYGILNQGDISLAVATKLCDTKGKSSFYATNNFSSPLMKTLDRSVEALGLES